MNKPTKFYPTGRPDIRQRIAKRSDDGRWALTWDGAAVLLEMAITDECPDGTFGDFECEVWSMFRDVLRTYGLI